MQIDTQPPAAAPLPAMPGFLRKHAQGGPGACAGTPSQRPAIGSARQGERHSLTGSMSVSSSSSMTALQHLAGRAAQDAAAAKGANEQTANRVCSLSQESSSHEFAAQVIIHMSHAIAPTACWRMHICVSNTAPVLRQVREALRAAMGAAARAAAQGPSKTLPQGSALLWSLLQECLRQQAEALIEQQSYKDAASDAMAQVWPEDGIPASC